MKKIANLSFLALAALIPLAISCEREDPTPNVIVELPEKTEVVTEDTDVTQANDNQNQVLPDIPYNYPKTKLSLNEEESKNIAPGNDFTFRYFAKEYSDAGKLQASIVSSPFSVQIVCGMIGNQIKDHKALCDMLGIEGDINDVNAYFNKLMKDVENFGGDARLRIANAFMKDTRALPFPEDFIESLKVNYLADYQEFEAKTLDKQPVGQRPEDLWVKDKTDGMIDSAPEPVLAEMASLFNVLCFKGGWVDKFDSKMTEDDRFFTNQTNFVERKFMRQTAQFGLYRGDDFSAINLPMGDGSYIFTIALPNKISSLDKVVESLNADVWNTVRKNSFLKIVELSIPRFSLSYNENSVFNHVDKDFLDSYLNQMKDLRMEEYEVTRIKQKARIDVYEEGTSAAVVTQAIMCTSNGEGGPGAEIEVFNANHPFAFMISEAGSGLVLFIGTYSGS